MRLVFNVTDLLACTVFSLGEVNISFTSSQETILVCLSVHAG